MESPDKITGPGDATDKQENLLKVAELLFAEQGFDGTSIRMIAEKSGMNVAMISYYFGSKEKMFEELIRRRVAHIKTLVDQLQSSTHLNPWQRWEKLVDSYVDRIMKNQARFHKLMMRELSLRKRPEIIQMIEERIVANMKAIYSVIEEGKSTGVFRDDIDFSMMMMMLFGTITHAMSSHNVPLKTIAIEGKDIMADPEAMLERAKKVLKTMYARYMLVHPEKFNY